MYALDIMLNLNGAVAREELEKAMADHVIENVELIGTYSRR